MTKIILNILFLSSMLISQNNEIRIIDIIVEGNERLSDQDIQRNAKLYKGMIIKGNEIQQAIKRLWNINRFSDIQILVDNETDKGIVLKIQIKELK